MSEQSWHMGVLQENVNYVFSCLLCLKVIYEYVGETENNIRKRINGHKSDIRHNKNKLVSKHFNQPSLSINAKTNQLEPETTTNQRTQSHVQIQLCSRGTKQELWLFIT